MDDLIMSGLVAVLIFGALGAIIYCFISGFSGNNPKTMKWTKRILITLGVIGVIWLTPIINGDADIDDGYYYARSNGSSGSDWDNYDYDNDGEINQGEWEDALGDYMDDHGY